MKRFVLTSIPSVPYLEAVLLLRRESDASWTAAQLGRRIYLAEAKASDLLSDLREAGIATTASQAEATYRYQPAPELRQMLDMLARHYSSNLVAVTDLIHSSLDRRAHRFADAFRWRKD